MHCWLFSASQRFNANDTLTLAQFDCVNKVLDVSIGRVLSRLHYNLFFFVKEADMREHLFTLALCSVNLNRGNLIKVYAAGQLRASKLNVSILG